MFERYFFPGVSILIVTGLLLACGIYSSSGWNILFLGTVLLLGLELLAYGLYRTSLSPAGMQDEPAPDDVFLVVGPYVSKWFVARNDESLLHYERQRLWLAARDAGELMKHLSRLNLQPQKVRITLFLPLLPDGHDTAALTIGALISWTKTLQSLVLPEPLPCVFAIYACFSQQRYGWDPDRVIWSGEQPAFSSGVSLDEAIGTLLAGLEKQRGKNVETDSAHVQKQSTLRVLRQWLEETRLLTALNALLNSSAVSLTHCLLADYGSGFIRHGAWARWLEEEYGLLPALAKSRIELSLPDLSVPAAPRVSAPCAVAKRSRHGLLIPLLLALVMGGTMLAASWYEKQRVVQTEALIKRFSVIPDSDIVGKFAALEELKANHQWLVHCANHFFFQNWGFAKCDALLHDVEAQLNPYSPWVIYSSASAVSLFASGNFVLLPEQADRLQPLAALVRSNPLIVFQIVGHSDNSGNAQQNIVLSQQRAREVRDWLINQTQANAERFVLKGVGDAFPLISNNTPEGKEINRRVDVIPLHSTSFTANESSN